MLTILLLSFILYAEESEDGKTNRFNLSATSNKMLLNILNNYDDYFLIVHYDNETYNDLDELSSTAVCKLLLNYDATNVNFKRPLGYGFVNLVYLNDLNRFERFSKIYFNLEFNDVIIFVITNAFDTNLIGLNRAASLILYNRHTNKLSMVKFYFGNKNGTLFDIIYENELPNLMKYVNKFTNFNGHTFDVGFTIYRPFVWCKYELVRDTSCNVVGTEAILLNDLSKKYNFSYNLVSFVDRNGGDWHEMIQAVHNGSIDWAISGITLTSERTKLADFTTALRNDPHELLYAIQDNAEVQLFYIKSPFSGSTWIVALMTLAMSLIILKCTSKYFRVRGPSCFLTFVRLMTDNPQSQRFFKSSGHRLLLSTLFCYSLLINTFYKSRLTATTIRPKLNELTRIRDFVRENYVFQVNNNDWSVLKEFLLTSTDPTHKILLNHIDDKLDYCQALKAILNDKVAFIDEFTYLKTGVVDECLGMFTKDEITSFRLTTENLIPYPHGWPMKLATPFRKQFSNTISLLTATGIIDKQINKENQTTIRRTNERIVHRKARLSIKLANLFGPFFILGLGHLIAIAFFLLEIFLANK